MLQAALEAVRLGTKDAVAEDSGDTSIKDVRAWSKLMKDLLNQRGRRGETPVMVACEEGSAHCSDFLPNLLLSVTWACLISDCHRMCMLQLAAQCA